MEKKEGQEISAKIKNETEVYHELKKVFSTPKSEVEDSQRATQQTTKYPIESGSSVPCSKIEIYVPLKPTSTQHKGHGLGASTVEFLKQKTLYKMEKQLWGLYESAWVQFKTKDHVHALAPIPPNTRVLALHVFLHLMNQPVDKLTLPFVLAHRDVYEQAYKQAKRQFLHCSLRIIDSGVCTQMKHELDQAMTIFNN